MIGLLRKNFALLREEFASYTSRERAFIFFAMLCAFFICCEYSLIRPVSNSLFIANFSAHLLPYAWLAQVPFNFMAVSLYNRLIPRWGSKRLFIALIFSVIAVNVAVAFLCKKFFFLPFAFYMWKEVYVLLMFQLVWSVIHANVQLNRAKYLYGIFYGIGGMGSVLGSSFPGFFAVSYGSENLIFLTLPIYLLLLFVYWKMSHHCRGDVPIENREEKGGFYHGIKLIRGSRFLIFALLIVIFMQMITAIVDFQFNDFLEKFFGQKDVRTEYSARIFGIVHSITVIFQFIGTYVLIKWMGFRRSHYFVPTCLALFSSLLLAFPIFPIACLTFITCKSLDFSVFGVIKEMLYVPLKPDEKFRAKAVIDIFAYRSAKAFSSLLILSITAFISSTYLAWMTMALTVGWILSVSYGLKEYEKLTKAGESG